MDFLTGLLFQTAVVLLGALASVGCALLYFRRVHLERPAIGVFNARDVVIVFCFVLVLPFLYILLPSPVLTAILCLTFMGALYIGLQPLLRPRYLWMIIPPLLALNIIVTETLLGTRLGWQLYWVITDTLVLLAVVGIANLYVQGGMRLLHVAWFALLLAVYDGFFAFVVPISQKLADRFEGQPLDPSIGFAFGPYNANIGLGDLLVYCLFITAAYKGFGRKGALVSFIMIGIFGAILPSMSPLIISAVIRANIGITIPAQVVFGPIAFLTYFWLTRRQPERNMAGWLSEQAAAKHEPIRAQSARVASARANLALSRSGDLALSDVPGTPVSGVDAD
jgi:hypothetical protein